MLSSLRKHAQRGFEANIGKSAEFYKQKRSIHQIFVNFLKRSFVNLEIKCNFNVRQWQKVACLLLYLNQRTPNYETVKDYQAGHQPGDAGSG